MGCGGSEALHKVDSFGSSISLDGPESGVREGNQNEGSLLFRASACSHA